jgi:hypothetical protein
VRAASLAGVAEQELERMDDVEYVARCLASMMRAGPGSATLGVFAYPDLTRQAFPALLRLLGVGCDPARLGAMLAQFDFDAKSFVRDAPFVGDSAAKQRAASAQVRAAVARFCADPHRELEASPRHLRGRLAAERGR